MEQGVERDKIDSSICLMIENELCDIRDTASSGAKYDTDGWLKMLNRLRILFETRAVLLNRVVDERGYYGPIIETIERLLEANADMTHETLFNELAKNEKERKDGEGM